MIIKGEIVQINMRQQRLTVGSSDGKVAINALQLPLDSCSRIPVHLMTKKKRIFCSSPPHKDRSITVNSGDPLRHLCVREGANPVCHATHFL